VTRGGLLQRVVSSIVFLPLFVLVTARGGRLYSLLTLLILLLAAREASVLFTRLGRRGGFAASAAGIVALWAFATRGRSLAPSGLLDDMPALLVGAVAVSVAALVTLAVSLSQSALSAGARPAGAHAGASLLPLLYPGLCGVFLQVLRTHEPPGPLYLRPTGAGLVFLLFLATWSCDTFAYFGGRAFGRRRMAPRLSPNKTWEGAISGFLAAMVAGAVAASTFAQFLSLRDGILIGGVLGITGQIGDLAESALKRRAHAKDAGAIIPGHGGVLDRFDSVFANGPVLYVLLQWIPN
jgi:phosphatidate cytidylyltransferase